MVWKDFMFTVFVLTLLLSKMFEPRGLGPPKCREGACSVS